MVAFDPPMGARRRVRLALREAREAARLTQQQVADQMEWSLSKVVRIETGEVSIAPNDLRPLLTYFGVDDHNVSAMLADARLARSRRRPPPPSSSSDLSETSQRLQEAEVKATELRCYAADFLPGPVRTPAYAAAVARLRDDEFTSSQLQARIDAGARRRSQLPARTRIQVLIDESVLRRPVGGRAVFAAQLRELDRPDSRLRIRMIPLSALAPVTGNGSFDLITLGVGGGTVLYREQASSEELVDHGAATQRQLSRFDRAWREALDETTTTRFLRERLSRMTRPAE